MAVRFNFSISITVPERELQAFRDEAVKRVSAQPQSWLEDILPGGFDPTSLEDCARVLFGDPIDAITGDSLEYDSSTCGLTSIEAVPDLHA